MLTVEIIYCGCGVEFRSAFKRSLYSATDSLVIHFLLEGHRGGNDL